MKKLYRVSLALGVATIVPSVVALILDRSVGYRIGPLNYGTYLWSEHLAATAVALALLALVCGLAARSGWRPVIFALFGLTPFLLMSQVHSGPNPEAWCYNNLRHIEAAKDQLGQERSLTNGTSVLKADISRLMPEGRDPQCAKRGTYIINPLGIPARCTVHGTIPEMEATWQKAMRSGPIVAK